jgi:hypothetical protein
LSIVRALPFVDADESTFRVKRLLVAGEDLPARSARQDE